MSEAAVIDFVTRAAPVIRQLERNTGRAARSQAIALAIYYSHRSTQRLLAAAEQFGYIQRKSMKAGWTLAALPTRITPDPAPCFRQLELPFARAA